MNKIEDNDVKHRGIRYTILQRIERGRWSVNIHPSGGDLAAKIVIGSHAKAEEVARSMIDRWLKAHPPQ